jgi:uncharacterized membrane protein
MNITHCICCSMCKHTTEMLTRGVALTYTLTVAQQWASATSFFISEINVRKGIITRILCTILKRVECISHLGASHRGNGSAKRRELHP